MRLEDKRTATDHKHEAQITDTKAIGKTMFPPAPKPTNNTVIASSSTSTVSTLVVMPQELERECTIIIIDVSLPQDEEDFPPLQVDSPPPAHHPKKSKRKNQTKTRFRNCLPLDPGF